MIATPRESLPPHIAARMRAWRLGIERLPATYIQHHELAALGNLARLIHNFGVRMAAHPRLVPSGHLDGMEVVRVVTQTRSGSTLLLQWSDEGAGGCFFVETGRGRHRLTAADLLENRQDPPPAAPAVALAA